MNRDPSTVNFREQDSGPSDSGPSDPSTHLRLAYQRLLALERFKSGFLARTSHELRSPINTIVSLHQLILEDLCESPEEEKEFLQQSKAAALKMLALFDQITAVSKLDVGREPPQLEPVDLSLLLPEVELLTTLQAANQNVRYTVASPTDEIEVYTDRKWLQNILVSLIEDAIPHTKTLQLLVEQNAQSVAVVIECDGTDAPASNRTAAGLQSQLESVAESANFDLIDSSNTEEIGTENIDNLRLSTALILATADIALPVIKGEFAIAPHSEASDRTCLRCIFALLD
ncbi:MAG: HAMP domain-containing histidine kinase [Phormidesmis sp. RL_2_1]|nr:HAMP domain-containing histidine kinase [Phormidesmis sp. RL_2_1]